MGEEFIEFWRVAAPNAAGLTSAKIAKDSFEAWPKAAGHLLDLSLSQLVTLAVGILAFVGALYAGGGILMAYTAPIWAMSIALRRIPVEGRPMVEWLPVACWWLYRTTIRQLLYRRREVVPRPVGTLALKGHIAWLREYTDRRLRRGCSATPTQEG